MPIISIENANDLAWASTVARIVLEITSGASSVTQCKKING